MPKVAVIQTAAVGFDTQATLARLAALAALAAEAAGQGAELMVFPEAFVGGYPKGLDFGARLGSRTAEGREDFARYHAAAIDIPGPETTRIGDVAAKHKSWIITGAIERTPTRTLYCSVLFFSPAGELVAKHRKLMPTALERLVWGFGDGSTLPVVDTGLGKAGAVICWENYMPMLRMAMYAKGVELYCAPTVDDRDAWVPSMQHIAYEGRCFVLSACQFAKRSDWPADYACIQGDNPETVLIRGGSLIASPFGEILAGPVYDEEAVLCADIDLNEIAKGKYDLDVAGHYARPDVFSLYVDEVEKEPVIRE